MAKITYIEHNGAEHVIDVKNGPLGDGGAVKNNIPGIDADCGGACACATWPRLRGRSLARQDRHAFGHGGNPCWISPRTSRANSRLSCQIRVSDEVTV